MTVPDSLTTYLRTFTQEMGERILQSFPPLHAVDDPPSPIISQLLRKPYAAQALAIMGLVCRWRQARGGRECVVFTNSRPKWPAYGLILPRSLYG